LFPNTNILHIDEYKVTSYPLLASASCSGATAAHAIELACIQPGDVVLIQGSGPLGLFLTAFAREIGASKVITVGGSPQSLALASTLGADLTISHRNTSGDDRIALIREKFAQGVDVVLESAGKADAVNEGIEFLRTGGAYISAGFAIPGESVTLDCYYEIVRKQLRLQGVWVSHTRHLVHALALVSRDPEKFEAMVTHEFPLDQATDALKAMEDREAIKSAIVF
jgi:threonine dehydrogenase-like Zn-dependent dehydrogenase